MLASTLVLALGGCGFTPSILPPPEVNPTDGNRGLDPGTTGPGKYFGEPNDTFASPITAFFNENGLARLQGTVESSGDLDVFVLGPMSAGDRISVDASTPTSDLDVSIALFDNLGRLVLANDDRVDLPISGNDLDSLISDFVVRHEGSPYYLVVTDSAFAGVGQKNGGYYADVSVTRGAEIPAAVGQILLLDFRGTVLNSETLGRQVVDPFSGAAISAVYAGKDDDLKQLILETVRQNYQRFNVTVLTSDDLPLPAGTEYSSIYLGGYDAGVFGIAEDVDDYNVDYCDDGIIYTETFQPSIFSRTPTVEEMAVAIGNVAAHEAGHLLGLNHVDDDRALMDDRSVADAFIEDQEFMEAPLSADIMRIGTQDAALLLYEIVGPAGPAKSWRRTGGY